MQNYAKIDSEMNKELTLSPRINKKNEISILTAAERTEKSKEIAEKFPFHPKINKTTLSPKSPEEMSYGPIYRKEENLRKIKEEIGEQEKSLHTFKPTINDSGVKSKLEYHDPNYVERHKGSLEQKRQKFIEVTKERQSKELSECTHAPKLNKRTKYQAPPIKKPKKGYSEIHRK